MMESNRHLEVGLNECVNDETIRRLMSRTMTVDRTRFAGSPKSQLLSRHQSMSTRNRRSVEIANVSISFCYRRLFDVTLVFVLIGCVLPARGAVMGPIQAGSNQKHFVASSRSASTLSQGWGTPGRRQQYLQQRIPLRHNRCCSRRQRELSLVLITITHTRGGSSTETEPLAPDHSADQTPQSSILATKKKGKKKKKKKNELEDLQNYTASTDAPDSDSPLPPDLPLSEATSIQDQKRALDQALHEKDAAEALGDAIRDRADLLRHLRDDPPVSPWVSQIAQSVQSVGAALGTSDQTDSLLKQQHLGLRAENEQDESGGVQAAPGSILAHYFLKSHGGAHALQCLCSILSAAAGLAACLWSRWHPEATLVTRMLVQRCLTFAMIKHTSGLLAATWMTARAIPEVGLRKARFWIQQLVTDPVSQYIFYAACLLVWLPLNTNKRVAPSGVAPIAAPISMWWEKYWYTVPLLVAPVLVREVISTALVVSDVLVLWTLSATSTRSAEGSQTGGWFLVLVKTWLRVWQRMVDAVMSILVTPTVWKSSNAQERQAILAKLTGKVTLGNEVAVGLLLLVDAVWAVAAFTLAATGQRPSVLQVLKRVVCTRLYLHFLWTRRTKIENLVTSIRGGASQFPFYVLEVLMHPQKAMGLDAKSRDQLARVELPRTPGVDSFQVAQPEESKEWTWKDYVRIAMGWDEDDK